MIGDLRRTRDRARYSPVPLRHVPDVDDPEVYSICSVPGGECWRVSGRKPGADEHAAAHEAPRNFYDLAIQVAIVRPGPIQGDMVHPYLRRRNRDEQAVSFPSPAPPHNPHELRDVLGKTLGVPLFQEQAMKLAIVAGGFTPAQADGLRRAMATFRNHGSMPRYEAMLIEGMVVRGYRRDFAERCFEQIKGSANMAFPKAMRRRSAGWPMSPPGSNAVTRRCSPVRS